MLDRNLYYGVIGPILIDTKNIISDIVESKLDYKDVAMAFEILVKYKILIIECVVKSGCQPKINFRLVKRKILRKYVMYNRE